MAGLVGKIPDHTQHVPPASYRARTAAQPLPPAVTQPALLLFPLHLPTNLELWHAKLQGRMVLSAHAMQDAAEDGQQQPGQLTKPPGSIPPNLVAAAAAAVGLKPSSSSSPISHEGQLRSMLTAQSKIPCSPGQTGPTSPCQAPHQASMSDSSTNSAQLDLSPSDQVGTVANQPINPLSQTQGRLQARLQHKAKPDGLSQPRSPSPTGIDFAALYRSSKGQLCVDRTTSRSPLQSPRSGSPLDATMPAVASDLSNTGSSALVSPTRGQDPISSHVPKLSASLRECRSPTFGNELSHSLRSKFPSGSGLAAIEEDLSIGFSGSHSHSSKPQLRDSRSGNNGSPKGSCKPPSRKDDFRSLLKRELEVGSGNSSGFGGSIGGIGSEGGTICNESSSIGTITGKGTIADASAGVVGVGPLEDSKGSTSDEGNTVQCSTSSRRSGSSSSNGMQNLSVEVSPTAPDSISRSKVESSSNSSSTADIEPASGGGEQSGNRSCTNGSSSSNTVGMVSARRAGEQSKNRSTSSSSIRDVEPATGAGEQSGGKSCTSTLSDVVERLGPGSIPAEATCIDNQLYSSSSAAAAVKALAAPGVAAIAAPAVGSVEVLEAAAAAAAVKALAAPGVAAIAAPAAESVEVLEAAAAAAAGLNVTPSVAEAEPVETLEATAAAIAAAAGLGLTRHVAKGELAGAHEAAAAAADDSAAARQTAEAAAADLEGAPGAAESLSAPEAAAAESVEAQEEAVAAVTRAGSVERPGGIVLPSTAAAAATVAAARAPSQWLGRTSSLRSGGVVPLSRAAAAQAAAAATVAAARAPSHGSESTGSLRPGGVVLESTAAAAAQAVAATVAAARAPSHGSESTASLHGPDPPGGEFDLASKGSTGLYSRRRQGAAVKYSNKYGVEGARGENMGAQQKQGGGEGGDGRFAIVGVEGPRGDKVGGLQGQKEGGGEGSGGEWGISGGPFAAVAQIGWGVAEAGNSEMDGKGKGLTSKQRAGSVGVDGKDLMEKGEAGRGMVRGEKASTRKGEAGSGEGDGKGLARKPSKKNSFKALATAAAGAFSRSASWTGRRLLSLHSTATGTSITGWDDEGVAAVGSDKQKAALQTAPAAVTAADAGESKGKVGCDGKVQGASVTGWDDEGVAAVGSDKQKAALQTAPAAVTAADAGESKGKVGCDGKVQGASVTGSDDEGVGAAGSDQRKAALQAAPAAVTAADAGESKGKVGCDGEVQGASVTGSDDEGVGAAGSDQRKAALQTAPASVNVSNAAGVNSGEGPAENVYAVVSTAEEPLGRQVASVVAASWPASATAADGGGGGGGGGVEEAPSVTDVCAGPIGLTASAANPNAAARTLTAAAAPPAAAAAASGVEVKQPAAEEAVMAVAPAAAAAASGVEVKQPAAEEAVMAVAPAAAAAAAAGSAAAEGKQSAPAAVATAAGAGTKQSTTAEATAAPAAVAMAAAEGAQAAATGALTKKTALALGSSALRTQAAVAAMILQEEGEAGEEKQMWGAQPLLGMEGAVEEQELAPKVAAAGSRQRAAAATAGTALEPPPPPAAATIAGLISEAAEAKESVPPSPAPLTPAAAAASKQRAELAGVAPATAAAAFKRGAAAGTASKQGKAGSAALKEPSPVATGAVRLLEAATASGRPAAAPAFKRGAAAATAGTASKPPPLKPAAAAAEAFVPPPPAAAAGTASEQPPPPAPAPAPAAAPAASEAEEEALEGDDKSYLASPKSGPYQEALRDWAEDQGLQLSALEFEAQVGEQGCIWGSKRMVEEPEVSTPRATMREGVHQEEGNCWGKEGLVGAARGLAVAIGSKEQATLKRWECTVATPRTPLEEGDEGHGEDFERGGLAGTSDTAAVASTEAVASEVELLRNCEVPVLGEPVHIVDFWDRGSSRGASLDEAAEDLQSAAEKVLHGLSKRCSSFGGRRSLRGLPRGTVADRIAALEATAKAKAAGKEQGVGRGSGGAAAAASFGECGQSKGMESERMTHKAGAAGRAVVGAVGRGSGRLSVMSKTGRSAASSTFSSTGRVVAGSRASLATTGRLATTERSPAKQQQEVSACASTLGRAKIPKGPKAAAAAAGVSQGLSKTVGRATGGLSRTGSDAKVGPVKAIGAARAAAEERALGVAPAGRASSQLSKKGGSSSSSSRKW